MKADHNGFGTLVSDPFGRLFQALKDGAALRGVLSKDGYQSAKVDEQCALHESDPDHERKVVLEPR